MTGEVLCHRYEITAQLQEGPLFTAYVARDRTLAKDVCIRIPIPALVKDESFAAAVEQVVHSFSGVRHPSVESMIEVRDYEGGYFLVSELTRGSLLSDRIRKLAPFSVPVAVGLAISLLEGLDALHSEHRVHGDVGDHSVTVKQDGSASVQLPGIWQAYGASPTIPPLILKDMAPYLAPEITNGANPSAASDVYSVGILIVQFIWGRLPFNSDTTTGMALKHANDAPPNLRAQNPAVPMVLDEIVKKALAKNPQNRYQNARELLADLRILQDAMRFGKTLTWPLRPGSGTRQDVAQVAPTMGAIPREKRKIKDEEQYARDVPVWFLAIFGAVGLACGGFILAFFVLNFSKPKMATVPELKSLSVAEAQAVLRQTHLGFRVSERVPSESVPEDRVISSEPAPGAKVKENSKVSVRVSAGSTYVMVPEILGHTEDEARSMLSSVGLRLDEDVEKKPNGKFESGRVYAQRPGARSKVLRSTPVHASVSTGTSETPPEENKNQDKPNYIYVLRIKLKDLPRSVDVRVERIDDDGNGEVIFNERREPNETVEVQAKAPGKQAKFRIFYDGALVSEVTKNAEEKEPAENP